MNKVLLNIKIKRTDLSKAEKKVAEYLTNNSADVLSLNITELANLCDTSEASVVRFSKKLGFNGYQQLKIAIAQETDLRPVGENITVDDSAFSIFEKVCNDIYCSLEKTKKTINIGSFQKCCDLILSAEKILIFGLGNSASVALDAAHKMLRLGMNVTAYTDNHMQAIAATHADKNSIIIGISHSGHSRDIIESMKIAKENGATTIAITHHNKSPINKVSDYSLETVSDETNYRILGLNSRIAQLAIIDTVYSYLVCHLKNANDKIQLVENVLTVKKYK